MRDSPVLRGVAVSPVGMLLLQMAGVHAAWAVSVPPSALSQDKN